MKKSFLTTLSVFFTCMGLVGANAEDETLIEFAIPISESLVTVLEERMTSEGESVKESLMYAGITFYVGSQVGIDNKNRTLSGQLAYTEACLVMELSRMFRSSTPEEVRRYFDFLGGIDCFPESADAQEGVDQAAAAAPASKSEGNEESKSEPEARP
tara:strand:+ start:2746 stop:3216 length:471 start_codon:yes stop_codon:yes gene_type:complete